VRLFFLSIRVEPGVSEELGLERTLEFSTTDFAAPNHELFTTLQDDYTHASFFRLNGPEFTEPLLGEIIVNAPEGLDDNTNGIPDFYEVSAEIPATPATGLWDSEVAGGEARLVWQRSADQHRGTVKIQLTSDEFGTLPEFTHAFEIIEYGATFEYERRNEQAIGLLQARRAGRDTATLTGPFVTTREPTNRLDQFLIGESDLINEAGQIVRVSIGDVERDADYRMDYFGAVAFWDGDPATPAVDYELYFIGFDDPNDSDEDGIPDLTDDLGPPPAPPSLEIARDAAGFRLTLRGEVGTTYTLQRSSAAEPEADLWVDEQQVTLTTTNEVLILPAATAPARYWRLRWP
jgi:hypothetical protein